METDALIDRYCAAWSEPDARRRDELLRPVWDDGASYSDPMAHVVGIEALLHLIEDARKRFPEARIARTTGIDTHNDCVRFGWQLWSEGAVVIPEGMDVVILSEDRLRLKRVIGFFGPLSSAAA